MAVCKVQHVSTCDLFFAIFGLMFCNGSIRTNDSALLLSTVAGFHIDCDVDLLLYVMLSK